ncbi:hypothetical protein [Dipodfec virus UOA04_Rod_468]|uniref:Uncharacterized protein n=1 Tax=Dipodfec virus UA06Rod_5 TaxID=2929325 RepID=A0A976R8P7_9VIRU|nr:hypothetical protein [Dipodfec virus UA06Rod_5]WGL30887.1 hypothetical protein [Dipodfec virus UOA04_Rod_468]
MDTKKIIDFIKTLTKPKRIIAIAVITALAYILVGCNSLRKITYSRDGDNVRFEKVDSVRIK